MKTKFLLLLILLSNIIIAQSAQSKSRSISATAEDFIGCLSAEQKNVMLREYKDTQRTNWDFVPREDRTGIRIGALNANQLQKFYDLVLVTAGDVTLQKIIDVRLHEAILRNLENLPVDDKRRDTTKYFIQIFGFEDNDKIWSWKFEGHHICINYVIKEDKVFSATPSVHCSNPAVVLKGYKEGFVLLKTERDMAKAYLASLRPDQKSKAIVSIETPSEIMNYRPRLAVLDKHQGLQFNDMSTAQQTKLKDIITYYIGRSSKLFVKDILKNMEKAGWDKFSFVWMGSQEVTPGNKHYYRIQSPDYIIEYDNFQNNGNHVHSIFRDVKNDFGDALGDHYKAEHP